MARSFLPQETIRKKRDGLPLSGEEIADFIEGVTRDEISQGQVAAFTMAVFFNGMERDEAVALTLAMRDSGEVLDWRDIDGPILDKHSTGGVGDNVSLMLAPIIAACGGFVPMISGRGLGHTGGTLDKLESIPGYVTQPDNSLFRKTVRDVGCAIIGQTGNLAPADKRIYAIRDVTATVESVPLITASILSKKLAAGLDGLVLDVKVGSGAFMPSMEEAESLATSLVEVANGAGMNTTALLTNMDHPLATAAGNAVEVIHAIDYLTGKIRDNAMHEVVLALCSQMLVSGGLANDIESGVQQIEMVLSNGKAAEHFAKMVSSLGGPSDLIDKPGKYLEVSDFEMDVMADDLDLKGQLGFDTREIGLAVIELGGGRTHPDEIVDHRVGITNIASCDWNGSDPICHILAKDEDTANRAASRIKKAMRVNAGFPTIRKRMGL